jgi:hypothetical protein
MLIVRRNRRYSRRALHVALGTVGAFAFICAPAAALTLNGAPIVRAGQTAHLVVILEEPATSCSLSFSPKYHTVKTVPVTNARIQWSWTVPKVTRSASWYAQVTCGNETEDYAIRVRGSNHAHKQRLYQGAVSVRQFGPPAPQADTTPTATEMFPLSTMECTSWGNYKRPDIYANRSSADPLGENWNAWTWAEHARAEGLSVSTTPQPGDIANWPISASSPVTGHVAYVESVGPTSVVVTEMNGVGMRTLQMPEGYVYDEMPYTLSELAEKGVVFIHQR